MTGFKDHIILQRQMELNKVIIQSIVGKIIVAPSSLTLELTSSSSDADGVISGLLKLLAAPLAESLFKGYGIKGTIIDKEEREGEE